MTAVKWIGGLIALFLAWALLRTPSPEEQAKSDARAAIGVCWDSQGRKSLDPSSARFVAGACERMEDQFRARFGHKP